MPSVERLLYDLSHLFDYQVVKVLKDGRRQGLNSVLLIEVRMRPAPRNRRTAQCVLKVFHTGSRNKSLATAVYANELAANTVLSAPYASPSAERACAELFEATSSRQAADRCYYPRCLGTVRVDDRQIWESGIHEFVSDGGGKGDVGTRRRKRASALDEPPSICRGFLLEYIEGIREITREMVTPSLAAELKVALATIHALNVRHNDFENHASWPEVRFGNLFVRPTGEPVILDFNRSTVLSDSAKDQALLKEEADKLSEMLEVALGKMDPWEGIPKETRRLLADSRDFRGRNG